jgi:hypothetical protein
MLTTWTGYAIDTGVLSVDEEGGGRRVSCFTGEPRRTFDDAQAKDGK